LPNHRFAKLRIFCKAGRLYFAGIFILVEIGSMEFANHAGKMSGYEKTSSNPESSRKATKE
jgi:hypothetical protein